MSSAASGWRAVWAALGCLCLGREGAPRPEAEASEDVPPEASRALRVGIKHPRSRSSTTWAGSSPSSAQLARRSSRKPRHRARNDIQTQLAVRPVRSGSNPPAGAGLPGNTSDRSVRPGSSDPNCSYQPPCSSQCGSSDCVNEECRRRTQRFWHKSPSPRDLPHRGLGPRCSPGNAPRAPFVARNSVSFAPDARRPRPRWFQGRLECIVEVRRDVASPSLASLHTLHGEHKCKPTRGGRLHA
jgi:hypothetical protein